MVPPASGGTMAKRSASRPNRMPPIMKPMGGHVAGSVASARGTLKSACTAGSATTRDHMPTHPSVLSVMEAARRIQEYEVSIEYGSGGTLAGFLVGLRCASAIRSAFGRDKAGFLFCRTHQTHAPRGPVASSGAGHDVFAAAT